MPLARHASIGIAALVPGLAAVPSLAQCQDWLPGDGAPPVSGTYRSVAMVDFDAGGPEPANLVVAGSFMSMGGDPEIRNLARWDGVRWRSIFSPFQFGNATFNAVAAFDPDADGPLPERLVVGGRFESGFPPNNVVNIVMTDGASVTRMSDGLNGEIFALHVFDADGAGPNPPELYAGGWFQASGLREMRSVARWDGAQWQAVGLNLSGPVRALASVDPDGPGPRGVLLAAGGDFSLAGGGTGVAFFNGVGWLTFNSYPQGSVTSLATFDFDGPGDAPERLVAVGSFMNSNSGLRLSGQAFFDGVSWQPIAPVRLGSTGRAIASIDRDGPGPMPAELIASGIIYPGDASQPSRVVRLQDGEWRTIADASYTGDVHAMKALTLPGAAGGDEPTMVLAGFFYRNDPAPEGLYLCTWDGEHLSPYPNGFNGRVNDFTAVALAGRRLLIAAGDFGHAPSASPAVVAAFDGASWAPVGNNMPGQSDGGAIAVIAFDPDDEGPEPESLIVGGSFDRIGGVAASSVARFDGKAWTPMGDGVASVRDLAAFDPDADGPLTKRIYASSGIISGGPGTPGYIYEWNGVQWTQHPHAFVSNFGPPQTLKMTTFDPDADGPAPRQLVILGSFNRVGSVFANNIAAFDGQTWRALGTGFNTNPQAVFTWDRNADGREVIVVGGGFTTAGGVPARGAAVWNGQAWSAIGAGFGTSMSGLQNYPEDFAVFDGALHATGYFSIAQSGPADGIARWSGMAWTPVGSSGLGDGGGISIAAFEGALCIGGTFQSVGGLPNAFFARYADLGCCPADYDGDGVVASADFFAFLADFLVEAARADFNEDGRVNTTDLFEFLVAFFGEC